MPSTSTVQAPHWPWSQPFLVPVRSRRSRSRSSRVVQGATWSSRRCPLIGQADADPGVRRDRRTAFDEHEAFQEIRAFRETGERVGANAAREGVHPAQPHGSSVALDNGSNLSPVPNSVGRRRVGRRVRAEAVSRSRTPRLTLGLTAEPPRSPRWPRSTPILNDIDTDLDNALERLFAFLRIPSISTDPAYAGHCREAAAWLAADLTALGLRDLRGGDLAPPGRAGAQAEARRAARAVLRPLRRAAGRPAGPVGDAALRAADRRPTRRARRQIVARGASDDKGQVMTFVEACRACIADERRAALRRHDPDRGRRGERLARACPNGSRPTRDELAADVVLVCDTGMWDPTTPAITSSLRGLAYFEVKVTCADRDLHSGFFGGAARNPIHVLSRIIADLHDADGRVTLPGFYDGVHETPARGAGAVARPRPHAPRSSSARSACKEPAGERGRHADRAGAVAPDLRRQRHHRRLYRRGHQDGDRRPGQRPRSRSASWTTRTRSELRRDLRGLRARADPGGLLGRGHHATRARARSACPSTCRELEAAKAALAGRVGRAGGDRRRRRLDPDRRRLQAHRSAATPC